MSMKLFGNFKVIAVILSIVLFMLIMYGYNRAEKKKLVTQQRQQQPLPQQQQQQQAMQAYSHPNIGKKSGCSVCNKK